MLRTSTRSLLALLCLLLGFARAEAQTVGAVQGPIMGSGPFSALVTQCRISGCQLYDWQNSNFQTVNPSTHVPTSYSNYGAIFAAGSGVASSSAKWCFSYLGILTQFAANTPAQPCFDGNGQRLGLMLENAATNNFLQWSAFTNAAWTKTGVSLVANNLTDPTGNTGASTITEDGSTGNHWLLQPTTKTASSLQYVLSCNVLPGQGSRNVVLYVDDNSGNGVYAIMDTIAFDPSVVPATAIGSGFTPNLLAIFSDPMGASGMVRLSLAFSSNSATTLRGACGLANGSSYSYAGDGTSGLGVWGIELKQNTIATGSIESELAPSSPVPTTTATVTRAIDRSLVQLPTAMQGKSAYSIFYNGQLPRVLTNATTTFAMLTDAANAQTMLLGQLPATSSGLFDLRLQTATTVNVQNTGPIGLAGQGVGLVARMQPTLQYLANSGQGITTSIANNFVANPVTQMRLGNISATATNFTGNISILQFAVFPAALSNTTLQSLLFATPAVNPDAVVPPNYFTQPMIGSTVPSGLFVLRFCAMPSGNNLDPSLYTCYPTTSVYLNDLAGNLASTATDTTVTFREWGERCDLCSTNTFNHKPNEVGGPPIRTSIVPPATTAPFGAMSYTTQPRAEAAMQAIALYLLDYPAHASGACPTGQTYCGYLDVTEAAGINDSDVVTWTFASTNADAYFTVPNSQGGNFMTHIDGVILPPGQAHQAQGAPLYGLLCVCEFADNRLASSVTLLMTQMTKIAHNAPGGSVKYMIAPDQLLGTGPFEGWCGPLFVGNPPNCDVANLNALANIVDGIFFVVSDPPTKGYTFTSQITTAIAQFGAVGTYPAGVLAMNFNMGAWPGGTTVSDAQIVKSIMNTFNMTKVTYTPSGAANGGSQCRPTNLKYEITMGLSTGSCPLTP